MSGVNDPRFGIRAMLRQISLASLELRLKPGRYTERRKRSGWKRNINQRSILKAEEPDGERKRGAHEEMQEMSVSQCRLFHFSDHSDDPYVEHYSIDDGACEGNNGIVHIHTSPRLYRPLKCRKSMLRLGDRAERDREQDPVTVKASEGFMNDRMSSGSIEMNEDRLAGRDQLNCSGG
ncbi:hypothetical protein SISSUDRAFT_1036225 [Sistotremastrum suecicum HHB10207 ss-3]|uniref:Uncharacterized protein n=1 Tax=Sistotremastrum suecicum HHB10207 ss-3 TaxID=1314776 RepID=A0A165ZQ14_9AGAM|nr:hypothetical protein SISSUDRAFT_1036225 [Sistotremastrum suecicum HHB10207 ss-3]